jgi:hypothetical protein
VHSALFSSEIQAVLWLWRLLAGLHREDLDSILDQSVLDLWWTEWRWDRFYFGALRFSPASCQFHSKDAPIPIQQYITAAI